MAALTAEQRSEAATLAGIDVSEGASNAPGPFVVTQEAGGRPPVSTESQLRVASYVAPCPTTRGAEHGRRQTGEGVYGGHDAKESVSLRGSTVRAGDVA